MCFSPKVSLATALIEFAVAAYIYLRYRANKLVRFTVAFLLLLGGYQFAEFMVCTTGNADLWGRIGFISYNFLPAVGLYFALDYGKWTKRGWIALLPSIAFAAVAVFAQPFIQSSECFEVFVFIKTILYESVSDLFWPTILYFIYYFGYILLTCILLSISVMNERKKSRKKVMLIFMWAILLSILPAFILLIFIPAWGWLFPSIYCQFALLFAIFAIVGIHMNEEYKLK